MTLKTGEKTSEPVDSLMDEEPEKFTVWHGLLLGEFCALLIALATTIVPSRSSSKHGISGHFFEEPTFLQEFLVNLAGVHVVFIPLALVVVVWLLIYSRQP